MARNDAEPKPINLRKIAIPIVVIAAGTALLYFAAPVLIILVLSAAFSYILMPLVNLLEKVKIPHWAAVLLVVLSFAALVIWLMYFIVGQIADLLKDLPQYQESIFSAIQKVSETISKVLSSFPGLETPRAGATSGGLQSVLGYFLRGVTSITNFLINIVAIFFLVLFMLLESKQFDEKIGEIVNITRTRMLKETIDEINNDLKKFILIRFYDFVGLSLVVTGGLLLMGVPYAYVWGPLYGFLNLIPHIGPIVAAIPAIIVAGIHHNSIVWMVWVTIFFLVIGEIEGHVIWPKLTGATIDLNGTTVLVALVYWGWVWGIIGLLLAVPVTSAFKVICDHIEPLRPIGILMGVRHEKKVAKSEQPER
jgi:predicted PurR-regulated permease PerM